VLTRVQFMQLFFLFFLVPDVNKPCPYLKGLVKEPGNSSYKVLSCKCKFCIFEQWSKFWGHRGPQKLKNKQSCFFLEKPGKFSII